MKQVTVFGASGKVGQQVVALALKKGYHVIAFVHSRDPFAPNSNLKVVKGDVRDRSAVGTALVGSQAVVSALGSWGTKEKDILTSGMQAIIPAMEGIGHKRLVTLTGAGAVWAGDQPGLIDKLTHALLGVVAPKILRDGEEHLRLLEVSKLDWTCLRSPVMRSSNTSRYQLKSRPPALWASIPRRAVAQGLVDQVTDQSYICSAPFIHHR